LDQDLRLMRIALELAEASAAGGEVPVGAVVAVGGDVIGRGRNSPIEQVDPTAHAEILALRAAAARTGNYRLPGATLYCTVEPCLMCLGAMLHARIGRLVFAASDPKVGATSRLATLREFGAVFNHDIEIEGGVLAAEASDQLLAFFRRRRVEADDGAAGHG
jgi:tRNA(adenine34) deaminase